jgi:thiol:disulfide interchange protein DsbC
MKIIASIVMAAALGAAVARADDAADKPVDKATAAAVSKSIEGSKPEDVRQTPVPGIYELRRGAEIVYVTRDGKYAFTGDLYEISHQNDLTEARRRDLRVKLIATVPESQMLIFSPKDPKYTVTVFTDVDCGYCRELHRQIADYNRLGVRVRYLSFPRTGPNTESWYKAEQVWCSPDRNAALTRAKLGQPLSAKVCANNPVAEEYALGKAVGLTGTPGIVTSQGELLPGYMPPEALVEQLKSGS